MVEKSEALERIEGHRRRIDELDARLLELLNERAAESLAIRALKPAAGMELTDAGREERILARLVRLNEGPMHEKDIRELYAALLGVMKSIRV